MRRRTVLGRGLAAVGGVALPGAWLRPASASDVTDVFSELCDRWRRVIVGPGAPDGAYAGAYAQAVAAQDRSAAGRLATLVTDPDAASPWPDLPLAEEPALSANVTGVASRLRAIAVACATEGGALHGDEAARARAAAGCRVLWRARYHAGQAQYGNWWDWEIGTPRHLTDTLTLLGPAVDAETRAGLLAAVDHFVPDPRRMLRGELESTGANRVDLCRVVALRGALGAAPERLALAAAALVGVVDPVLVGDGFHPDGSFLMHTWVAYPGTYGEVLVKGMAELMLLLAGTEWDVGAAERRLTTEAIDRTFAPFVHRGVMLDAVRGRAISRDTATDADDGFKLAVDLLTLADALPAAEAEAEAAGALRATAKSWLADNAWRPLAARQPAQIAAVAAVADDAAITPAAGPLGHFGYPDMERFVHRRPGWTYCLSLNSDRVARYEYMNGENARGWHTGDGMHQLALDTDPFHYTDAYWPTCDAKRLPGVTVDTTPLPVGAGGDNDNVPLSGAPWSGEVRLGDLALAGLDLRGIDSTLRARRSWLFLPDAVLTAGSGITATGGRRIETVVEHRRSDGELTVDDRPEPRWAHLAGVAGYVFPHRPSPLNVRREERTGAWSEIRQGGPTARITRRFVTLWQDHGVDPVDAHHAHLLLPGATAGETAARAREPGVEVVRLDRDVHAFRAGPLTAVAFFSPGTAAGVTADAPCAVLVRPEGRTLRVAVADPARRSATLRLTLARHGPHTLREADPGLTLLPSGPGTIRLHAELAALRGTTLTATLTRHGH
ncbi:polysaccharide lyase 8 family protein [Streptomyces sp. NPDC127098]|uniref:polysaccharide lyase 8 family protein n=1 Tax=Streptomyces sp. NPDC127098 TaxID=3347137 RepID=UPI0036486564